MKKIVIILSLICFSCFVGSATSAVLEDTVSVYGKSIPTATINNGYYSICAGDTVHVPVYLTNGPIWDITYSDGISSWTINGITTSPYQLAITLNTPGITRTYVITSVSSAGCSGTFSGFASVTVSSSPAQFNLTCTNPTFCPGGSSGSFRLHTSTLGETYWLTQDGITVPGTTMFGTGDTLHWTGLTTTGTVQAMAQNPTGCISTMNGSIVISQNSLPGMAAAINGPTDVCAGTTNVTYSIPSAIPGVTAGYTWSVPTGCTITSNTGMSIIVTMGSTSGNIVVSGNNACGPGLGFSLPVNVELPPTLTMTAPVVTVCEGDPPVSITASGSADTWLWSTGATTQTISLSPPLTGANTYSVTASYASSGCSVTGSIIITLNPLPTPTITMPNTTCMHEVIALSGTPAGGTWSGLGVGIDSLYTDVCGVGTHTVSYSVTNSYGCETTVTHYITVNPLPIVTWSPIPGPFNTETPPLDLSAYVDPPPGSGLAWSFSGPGMIGSSFDAGLAGPGTHLIGYTFTHFNGCSQTQGYYIAVNTVGIDEISAAVDAISMYPNPAENFLTLTDINTKEVKSINILDVTGRMMYKNDNLSESSMQIEVNTFAAGPYLILFISADGYSVTKHFVKQ